MMKLSNTGINLIKSFEGLRLNAYQDSAGIWTIGYGCTKYQKGEAVKPKDKLENEQQACALFYNILTEYENAVNKYTHVMLSQNQFDALVSITYNVGPGIMQGTTLVSKLNAKDYIGAANQFLVWNKITDPVSHAKVVCGTLLKRRKKERELFLKADMIDYDTKER